MITKILNYSLYFIFLLNIFSSTVFCQVVGDSLEIKINRSELIVVYDSDSTLATYYNLKEELLNGKYKIIANDSSTVNVAFLDGLKHKKQQSFYPTGELLHNIFFQNGYKINSEKWYYKSGVLEREIPYLNKKRNGFCKWYHNNGALKRTCNFINGKENGICKWYYDNGNIQNVVTYKMGLKHGHFRTYNAKGIVTKKGYYLNNSPVTKKQFNKSKR